MGQRHSARDIGWEKCRHLGDTNILLWARAVGLIWNVCSVTWHTHLYKWWTSLTSYLKLFSTYLHLLQSWPPVSKAWCGRLLRSVMLVAENSHCGGFAWRRHTVSGYTCEQYQCVKRPLETETFGTFKSLCQCLQCDKESLLPQLVGWIKVCISWWKRIRFRKRNCRHSKLTNVQNVAAKHATPFRACDAVQNLQNTQYFSLLSLSQSGGGF